MISLKARAVALLILAVAASAVSAQYCALPYTNTPGDGLWYVSGMDYYGNDLYTTANVADGWSCYQLCASKPPTPAVLMWAYDTSVGGNSACWCKGAITTTPVLRSNRMAGPMSGQTLGFIPSNVVRQTVCAPGITNIQSDLNQQSCQGYDGWDDSQLLGCNAYPCNMTFTSAASTGFVYVTGYNWNGHDQSATPQVQSPYECWKLCDSKQAELQRLGLPPILMWQYDSRANGGTSNGACWCKDQLDPSPTQNGNRAAGPMRQLDGTMTVLPGFQYGDTRTQMCWSGYRPYDTRQPQLSQYCDSRYANSTGGWTLSGRPFTGQCYPSCRMSATPTNESFSTGLLYIKDTDWFGNDVVSTKNIDTAYECMMFCNTSAAAWANNPLPIIAWTWESQRTTGQCWCKSAAINLIPNSPWYTPEGAGAVYPIYLQGRAAGLLPGVTTSMPWIPVNAVVKQACPNGYISTDPSSEDPRTDGSTMTCTTNGYWVGKLTNRCRPGSPNGSGLSAGAIAGIVIGIIAAFGCCVCFFRWRKNSSHAAAAPLLPQQQQQQQQQQQVIQPPMQIAQPVMRQPIYQPQPPPQHLQQGGTYAMPPQHPQAQPGMMYQQPIMYQHQQQQQPVMYAQQPVMMGYQQQQQQPPPMYYPQQQMPMHPQHNAPPPAYHSVATGHTGEGMPQQPMGYQQNSTLPSASAPPGGI